MSMEDDTRELVIRKHGLEAFQQANRDCAELIVRILPLFTGHSNLAVGNALVTLAAAVARADDVPPATLAAGVRAAYDNPHVISLAGSMRAAMEVRANA